jgi:anti-sigma B factor antagonist
MVQVSQEYTSDLRHLSGMRALVADACRQAWGAGVESAAIEELQLAVNEAAANIIRHAYSGATDQRIEVVIKASPEDVCVTLYHHGRAFDPNAAPPPAFDGSRMGGFGLYMIEKSVDEVEYSCDTEGRRGIRLLKRRPSTRKGDLNMRLTVDMVGNVAVVAVNVDSFDASNSNDFKQEIAPVLEQNSRLVLDLGQVQFVDSSGCAAILSCLKQLTAVQGDVKLCQVNKPVRSVFDLIRLHRICDIFGTREEAVQAFAKKG